MKKTLYWILLLSLFVPLCGHAQEETVYDTILVLTHKEKGKKKHIKSGKNIKYWLNGVDKKRKGKIEHITDSVMEIGDTTIAFSDLRQLRAKSTGLKIMQASGIIVLVPGALFSGFGSYLIYYAYAFTDPNNDGCSEGIMDIMLVTAGVLLAATGVIVLAVGAIPLVFTGKKFDLEKWDLTTEIVVDKKASRKLNRQKNSDSPPVPAYQ
jgi:hypothetical protein